MDGQLVQLAGSLIAILVLAAIAWALKLGQSARINGPDHARALARDADDSFDAEDAAVSHDGMSAIVAGGDRRIMVLRGHGTHFAGRSLSQGASALCNDGILTIIPADRHYGPVTLDLGDRARVWASRVDALEEGNNA